MKTEDIFLRLIGSNTIPSRFCEHAPKFINFNESLIGDKKSFAND